VLVNVKLKAVISFEHNGLQHVPTYIHTDVLCSNVCLVWF